MSNSLTIAVVGVGAIGGAMAAALGDCGHRVSLCVRTPFEALVRILDGQERRYDHPVVTEPSQLEPVDWVFACTKAHQVEAAAPWFETLVGPETRVAVMQNGVEHVGRLAPYAPCDAIIPGVVLLPAVAPAPGVVQQARAGVVRVPATGSGQALASLFATECPVRIEPIDDFVSALWTKLVDNAAAGAVCALTLQPLRAFSEPVVRDLALALVREIMAVGRAEGARFPEGFESDAIERFLGPIGDHWTSIAVDRREGRKMEWEARNAVVGRIGRAHGIPTPMNDALTALLALADEGSATGR